MQMHVWRLNTIAAAVLVLIVSGCGKPSPPSSPPSNPSSSAPSSPASNPASNPLIGKWKLADQSENDLSCISLVEVEFTEKTVTTMLGPTRNTVTVTYGRDGDSYLASAGNGQAYRIKIESGGIEANGCHLVPASAKSSPIIGKWKLVPGQDEECRELDQVEFAEATMTMTFSEQAQKAGKLSSPTLSPAVTYSRDGDTYSVAGTLPSGESKVLARVKIESGGIEVFDPGGKGCHFVPAS
jgi:hypothetical protein